MQVYVTTPDKKCLLARQSDIVWAKPKPGVPGVTVEPKARLQPFLGVGAALTDSSAWLLMKCMPDAMREATLRALFTAQQGAGFSVLRICIGASDFNVSGDYTYCDYADPELRMFSIHREREYLIPLLKEIQRLQPRLILMATPWSPPAWMKTGKSLHGGHLDPAHYATYATYLTKYVQAMAAEGVRLDYITPQNEPAHETSNYPSMGMNAAEQARFIGAHLGPAFASAKINTKILCWDHNWDKIDFPLQVLADPLAARYTAGSAFHGYAGDVASQGKVQAAFPDKEIHFTESSGGLWAKDFGGNIRWDLSNLLLGSVRYGSRSVLKWNLVLDENSGPQNGGCDNCRGIVTLNRRSGETILNEEFYAFAHVGRFVLPGSHVIKSSVIEGVPNAAWLRQDGTRILVCCSEKEAHIQVIEGSRAAQVIIPKGSAVTVTWR